MLTVLFSLEARANDILQPSKASRRWLARLFAGLVWAEDLETVIKGWRTRGPLVRTMRLGCGGLVLSWMGHFVLAVGSSWLLCEFRRNVSLYISLSLQLIL